MSTNTIKLHRILRAPGERIYRAFTNPDAYAKWLPPHGFFGKVHHMDAKVGGTYRMSFTNLTTGHSHAFAGKYLELIPGEHLRYTATFEDPSFPGEMVTTIKLTKVPVGTEIHIEESGLPAIIPIDACHLGWQESLTLLAQLVEPEINQ
jgi:uncharacterized protein YndB with AHSA1/START domain